MEIEIEIEIIIWYLRKERHTSKGIFYCQNIPAHIEHADKYIISSKGETKGGYIVKNREQSYKTELQKIEDVVFAFLICIFCLKIIENFIYEVCQDLF